VLLVPLTHDAEPSLLNLVLKPEVTSPKLRTIGLAILLRRLEQLMGGLPIDGKRRSRMVEIRNGAIHVGTPAQSRHVLLDALAVCRALLERSNEDPRDFFGVHHDIALSLLDQKRSEVGHQVAAKLARARSRLRDLEKELGEDVFKDVTDRLQAEAADVLDAERLGLRREAVDADCPCGSKGRLFGDVDVDADVDVDIEPLGGGRYARDAYVAGWFVTLMPQAFACHVCGLQLNGPDELSEGHLPAARIDIEPADLGDDFDPAEYAESRYGIRD
jgi:hypothetical protein